MQSVITLPAWDDYPTWAPDGQRLAFVSTGETDGVANSEVFIGWLDGSSQRITFNTARDEWPAWSPDGRWLAASSDRDGDMDIYLFTADGDMSAWLNWEGFQEQPSWSPDGEWLAFLHKEADSNGNGGLNRVDEGDFGAIWVGRRSGGDFREVSGGKTCADPAWSPDGRYVVAACFWDSSGDGFLAQNDNSNLFAFPVAGGEVIQITSGEVQDRHPDWTR